MRTKLGPWALGATTLFVVLSARMTYSEQKRPTAPPRDEMRKILAQGHENRERWYQTKDENTKEALDAALRPILQQARLGLQEVPASRGDQVRFVRMVLNSTGAKFDAVRFRTPATGESYRLVWEIVVPGNDRSRNLQDWNIVSAEGPAPIAEDYSRRDSFDLPGAGFPPENFCITADLRGPSLRPDSEYYLWFDLKSDQVTPAFVKVAIAPDDEVAAPRSATVLRARRTFQTTTNATNQRYDAEVKRLRKTYLAELDKAKAANPKADEAETDRIAAEADEIVHGEAAGAGRRGFRLIEARYGMDDRWVDVTDQLRPLVRGNVLRFGLGTDVSFKPDPAHGTLKRLIIVYSLDGNPGVSITGDQQRVELPPTAPMLGQIPAVGSTEP